LELRHRKQRKLRERRMICSLSSETCCTIPNVAYFTGEWGADSGVLRHTPQSHLQPV
jgi:hypothetical protein